MDLYQKLLMEHYHNPQNYGHLDNPDFTTHEYNPSCGDVMTVEGCIQNTLLVEVKFRGKGCIISQAAGSLVTQECKGKTIDDILALTEDTIQTLIKAPLGPLRLKCALLALHALQEGIRLYQKK